MLFLVIVVPEMCELFLWLLFFLNCLKKKKEEKSPPDSDFMFHDSTWMEDLWWLFLSRCQYENSTSLLTMPVYILK